MNAKENNRQIYNSSWMKWENAKQIGPASRWQRWLACEALSRSHLSDVATILDFGCGTGVNTSFIAQLFPEAKITGCDLSRSGIDIAKQRYQNERIRFLVDDGTETLREHYDLISCFEVLEHLQEWKPLLRKMVARSRYLVLSAPTGRMRPFEKKVGHVRNMKRGELESELLCCEAKQNVVYNAGFPFYSPFYREICQLTGIGTAEFTQNRYGRTQRIMAHLLFLLFRYGCSRYHGDQFCGVFSMEKNALPAT